MTDANTAPETIQLSEEGWAAFMAALENPPKPTAELKKLMTEFGEWPAPAAEKPAR